MDVQSVLTTIALPIALGIGAWFAVNFAGKPILELEETRKLALAAATRYWAISPQAVGETRARALAALYEAASALNGFSRAEALASRTWCRVFGYDLDFAAGALRGLAEGIRGKTIFPDEQRKLTVDAVHLSLNATRHLSATELAAARDAIERTKHPLNDENTC